MKKRRNDALLESLALHISIGGRVVRWAETNDVPERTARLWANLPEVKQMVRDHRGVIIDRALGQHCLLIEKAIKNISVLMDHAENEATRYQANRNIISDLANLAKFADFEQRLAALEAANDGQQHQGTARAS